MSQVSNASEHTLTNFEDGEDTNYHASRNKPKSHGLKKHQKNKDLGSEHGSTTSTGSYSSTFIPEDDDDVNYEDQGSDPDMELILNALEKSVDNSGKLQNKTFSDQKIREIERTNSILMNRILSHNRRANRYTPAPQNVKLSSSALNRKKQQRQIDHDNLILLRKIQTVKPAVVNHQKR